MRGGEVLAFNTFCVYIAYFYYHDIEALPRVIHVNLGKFTFPKHNDHVYMWIMRYTDPTTSDLILDGSKFR